MCLRSGGRPVRPVRPVRPFRPLRPSVSTVPSVQSRVTWSTKGFHHWTHNHSSKFAGPPAQRRVRPSLKGGTESARFGCAESLAAQCVDRIAGLHCPLVVKLALRLLCVWCYVAVATWFCFCFAFTSLLQRHAVASSSSSSSSNSSSSQPEMRNDKTSGVRWCFLNKSFVFKIHFTKLSNTPFWSHY